MTDSNRVVAAQQYRKYRAVINRIGINSVSEEELQGIISSSRDSGSTPADMDLVLERDDESGEYAVDTDAVVNSICAEYAPFIPVLGCADFLGEYISNHLPDYTLCKTDERNRLMSLAQTAESERDALQARVDELEAEVNEAAICAKELQTKLNSAEAQYVALDATVDDTNSKCEDLIDYVRQIIGSDTHLHLVTATDADGNPITTEADSVAKVKLGNLSLNPGIYGFKRPSYFTEISTVLNKSNIATRDAKHTFGAMRRLNQTKQNIMGDSAIDCTEKCREYDVAVRRKSCDPWEQHPISAGRWYKSLLTHRSRKLQIRNVTSSISSSRRGWVRIIRRPSTARWS